MTFSLLALTLAAAGIYGLLAFGVALRRYDIGIRMALGATGPVIARESCARPVGLALAGVVAGGSVRSERPNWFARTSTASAPLIH